ncbi:hypothetical protein MW887_009300 [Aspergillus wentii]|nr:hypothetical protein MW887_009300 [Aspergillus wentii]
MGDIFSSEKPYMIVSHMPWLRDSQKANIGFMHGPQELITDVRGSEDGFTLDQHGLRFIRHIFSPFHVGDLKEVARVFYLGAEAFLKHHADGGDRSLFFDYCIRSNKSELQSKLVDVANSSLALPPARGVHIDQRPAGALKRVRLWEEDEADSLIEGRVRILK